MTKKISVKNSLLSATVLSGAFLSGTFLLAPNATAQEIGERGGDEIIVTAQKRAQSINDVSAAISALGSDELVDKQLFTLEDLQVAVPGITIGNDFAFAKIFVRGIGLNSALSGIDPSVALHVDGAVVAQASQQFASLFDLERVEVLRGPQGTLYGRNATAGSVNLITAKPTDEFEGYTNVTIGGGDLNLIFEGAVSGPLTDGIQGRVAFRHQNRDGFGINTGTGEDIDDANKLGIRGQLNFDLGSRVTNLISAEYYQEDEASKSFKFFGPSFEQSTIDGLPALIQTEADAGVFTAGEVALLLAQIPNLVTLAGDDALLNSRDAGGDLTPVGDLETISITNTFDWEINDWLNFRSLSNYRDGDSILQQDFDVSNLVNGVETTQQSTVQGQITSNEQFSQELQFILTGNRWRGLIGAYYFDESVASDIPIGTNPLAVFNTVDARSLVAGELAFLLPDARVDILGDLDIQAGAIFGNFTFDVTNKLRIKLGARQSWEGRDIVVDTILPGPNIILNGEVGPPNNFDARNYSDFSPEAGLEFDWGDSLFYFTYSQGFKSGAASLVDGTPELLDQEEITNYEIGVKGSYFDGALNLAVSGYLYNIEGVQFDQTNLQATPPFFSTSVVNAAAQDGIGIEIEGSWRLTENFRIDFDGTYNDIEFDEFDTTNPIDPLGALEGLAGLDVRLVDLSGNSPRNTPEFSFGIGGTYTQELANGAYADLSVNYAYKDEQFFTEFNDERLGTDAYGILDANLKYTFPNEDLFLNLWVKNLTDEFVASGAFAVSTSRTIGGTFLPPRQYGITLGYSF